MNTTGRTRRLGSSGRSSGMCCMAATGAASPSKNGAVSPTPSRHSMPRCRTTGRSCPSPRWATISWIRRGVLPRPAAHGARHRTIGVPYPNNRVELRYLDDERRSEHLTAACRDGTGSVSSQCWNTHASTRVHQSPERLGTRSRDHATHPRAFPRSHLLRSAHAGDGRAGGRSAGARPLPNVAAWCACSTSCR